MQQRRKWTIPFEDTECGAIKNKVLEWLSHSGTFLYLDSHGYEDPYGHYEMLAACESIKWIHELQELSEYNADWRFGHLSFNFKNELFRGLKKADPSVNPLFEDCSFFVPQTVCYIPASQQELIIESFSDPQLIARQIMETVVSPGTALPQLIFARSQNEAEYSTALEAVLSHIAAGNCYELNYCSEAAAHAPDLNPLTVYRSLKEKASMPFSAFYRQGNAYMMGASPERYFCKRQHQLIAQPIKGTAPRGLSEAEDEQIKKQLKSDPKEQAENVMIVDLMRNDLARCCEIGSVQVAELFGVYTFPTVHQLISTVTGTMLPDITLADIFERTFPMGSMTGAPKKRVLEITEELEATPRGLYAGTVGYQSPDGDADFNVVIRSLMYDATNGRLSYHSGGAITRQSRPAQEWAELLLKGRALEELFR